MPSNNKKSPRDVRFTEELAELLIHLEPGNKYRKWMGDMVDLLWEDMTIGESIPKRQIPKYYIRRHEVTNLYRFEHPEGHRTIYTLKEFKELGVCPLIIETLTHYEYNRRFGYKKNN